MGAAAGAFKLGGKRSNDRAVQLDKQITTQPTARLPGLTQLWTSESSHRLLHSDDVTHKAISLLHWRLTRLNAQHSEGPVLFIQDGSQLDLSERCARASADQLFTRPEVANSFGAGSTALPHRS